ncbi:30S ribosomal protein S4 [Candidatus Roizmanbacteria bacterium]|nr:30S ribosomal protein S4 [Candidatus Roizmanbacteria bacterium]
MRYTGSKNKVARREGMDLGLKTPGSKSQATLLKKLTVLPGQHGTKGRRKISEYGRQLREKQKLRFMFGLTETKLKSYFSKAARKPGDTSIHLSELLEKRLDNVVYRLGLAPTRAASRQLISHKHITIADKVVSIPSYLVKVGDVIGFRKAETKKIPAIEAALEKKDEFLAPWLERKADHGKLAAEPTSEILEKQINLRFVVEYYSR